MKSVLWVGLSLSLIGLATARAEEPAPAKGSVVMAKKLEYSQQLLSALMTENYDEADRNVKLMKIFTRLEEMYRGKTPEYKAQLKKFQDSVTQLSTAVEAKQHDAASQAYLDMLKSCIQCHKTLQKAQ
jgi:hypothetical protein